MRVAGDAVVEVRRVVGVRLMAAARHVEPDRHVRRQPSRIAGGRPEVSAAARAMGIYTVVERLGQVLGPVSLGIIIAVWGRNAGLGVMAIGLAAMSLAFAVASRRQPSKNAALTARS